MWNRDSLTLWLAFFVALIGYLTTTQRPPTEWGYMDWLNALSFVLAWGAGKLATSPLKGKDEKETKA